MLCLCSVHARTEHALNFCNYIYWRFHKRITWKLRYSAPSFQVAIPIKACAIEPLHKNILFHCHGIS